jgi:chaperonin GroES
VSAVLDTLRPVPTNAATHITGLPSQSRRLPTKHPLKGEQAMNVKPLNDRVLVKRIESEERSAGGIIIPDTAKEKPQEGTVIAVGPGKLDKGERIALNVAIGDRVLFGKYSGTEVNIAGVEHTLLREEDIFAVLG